MQINENSSNIMRSKNLSDIPTDLIGRKSFSPSCGMDMELIEWFSGQDVTIRFEDGAIKRHCKAQAFKRGSIKHPLIHNRSAYCFTNVHVCEGQQECRVKLYSAIAPDGARVKMTFLEMSDYAKAHGYDYPEWEQDWSYAVKITSTTRLFRVGERRTMNNGQEAEIIRYSSSKDCDVLFEDGYLATHKYYRDFVHGLIRNPTFYASQTIGETNVMKNGQTAQIIAVRNNDDCDIKFDDGTVVSRVTVNRFREGSVQNPNMKYCAKDKLHEKKQQLGDLVGEITRYNNANDIDVLFASGAVARGQKYKDFCRGMVLDPSLKIEPGTEHKMAEGGIATVTRVTHHGNLHVRFDSGYTPARSIPVKMFLKGKVIDPKRRSDFARGRLFFKDIQKSGRICGYKENRIVIISDNGDKFTVTREQYDAAKGSSNKALSHAEQKIGECKSLSDSISLKILHYRSTYDMDVELSPSGHIFTGKSYQWFKEASLNTADIMWVLRVGEKNRMHNGQQAEIISIKDIPFKNGKIRKTCTVRFEDGTIVEGKEYRAFKNGSIGNPNLPKGIASTRNLIGTSEVMKNGQIATIISASSKSSIDLQFEDGTIVKSRPYSMFLEGRIANPNFKYDAINARTREKRVGERRKMKCGLFAEIIAYADSSHMTVRLENNEIFENVSYARFCADTLKPSVNYIGMKSVASNGQEMEIIAVENGLHDITVRFEDGTVVEHKRIDTFRSGQIANPNLRCTDIKRCSYIGKEYMLLSGIRVKILDVSDDGSYIIQAEDGTQLIARGIYRLEKGLISHPELRVTASKEGDSRIFCGYTVIWKEVQLEDGRALYKVMTPEKNICIMSPQLMMAYARLRGEKLPDWSKKYCEEEIKRIQVLLPSIMKRRKSRK